MPLDERPPEHSGTDRYEVEINDKHLTLTDPAPDGRKLLREGRFEPADEHVLIELLQPGVRAIGLDDEVRLRANSRTEFRAFRSDRLFTFTVDGRGYEWGEALISERSIRRIAQIPEDRVLVLERDDGHGVELSPDAMVDLAERGTERIRSHEKLVTVLYNHNPFELPRGVYTTEQLNGIFKVPAGYVLERWTEDGEFAPMKPGESIRLHEGMEFISHAPCGKSS